MTTTVNIRDFMNADEQKELFLWKFRDIDRAIVNDLFSDFSKFAKGQGQIHEHDAMRLLEFRGEAKTLTEFRASIKHLFDLSKNHSLSFLEWCCAFFNKPMDSLNEFADEEARDLALAEAREIEQRAVQVEKEIAEAKAAEEEAARRRAAELEEESKLTGVAGMRAFFARQVEGAADNTLTNAQKITMEATRRRALRETKQQLNAALEEASRVKTAEDVKKEMQRKAVKSAAEAAAEAASAAEKERAERAARKAALNAKWGGGLPPPPVKKS